MRELYLDSVVNPSGVFLNIKSESLQKSTNLNKNQKSGKNFKRQPISIQQ